MIFNFFNKKKYITFCMVICFQQGQVEGWCGVFGSEGQQPGSVDS